MAHILFIDPIEKLNIKKDSSLMAAISFQKQNKEVYLLFEEDFYVNNLKETKLRVYDFEGKMKEDGYYIDQFSLKKAKEVKVSRNDTIHMRIDPPYDMRYHRYLWMLDFISIASGCNVVNNPVGIMKRNDKIEAFKQKKSVDSFVGASRQGFEQYVEELKEQGCDEIILKPLDLYSGIGVGKFSISDEKLIQKFTNKVEEYHGAIIAQPFLKAVYDGEYRAVYFDGNEVGSIMKRPKDGEFLTNIAQGAAYEKVELPPGVKESCDQTARELLKDGIRIIAFDVLGEAITEVNITCPGLFVEVSYANKKNLADLYASLF